jgi:hypothetical protein
MAKETWKFGLGMCAIKPKVDEALKACATDPEAWMKTAALIPGWRDQVRPGTTTDLEEMLWTVLLEAWTSFDSEDHLGATKLVDRLRLARDLDAPSRPDSTTIDVMEATAPHPQLIVPAQSCKRCSHEHS